MLFKLPPLPFVVENISNWLSADLIELHYGRHHKSYVEKLNTLLKGSGLEEETLENIVKKSSGNLFNNAAQAWNHQFYWQGISASTSNQKDPLAKFPELKAEITKSFGSYEKMKEKFTNAANTLFGSGWAWLVYNEKSNKLEIIQTTNAENPMTQDLKPLLTCDVWEHAYYVDFLNVRNKYVEGFIEFINWDFVNTNFKNKGICNLTQVMKADASDKGYPKNLN